MIQSGVESPLIRLVAGRKLWAFIIYVVLLTGFAYIMTRIQSPEPVVVQGMWMITYAGIFVIGGQALIDALVPIFGKATDSIRPAEVITKKESTTTETETVK